MEEYVCYYFYFFLLLALILSLIAAMVITARALLDLQKRDITPFLAPTLVSSGRENQYGVTKRAWLPLWRTECLCSIISSLNLLHPSRLI